MLRPQHSFLNFELANLRFMKRKGKGKSSNTSEPLTEPPWGCQKNTYPFDWTINVKLPFESALSGFIILQSNS